MLKPLLTALLALILVDSAVAGEIKLPSANPLVVVTVPDSWKTDSDGRVIQTKSDTGGTYITIESTTSFSDSPEAIDQQVQSSIHALMKDGLVSIDSASKKQRKYSINEKTVIETAYSGKDTDGPCLVIVNIMKVTDKAGLVLVCWGSDESALEDKEGIENLLKSTAAAKN